MQRCLVHHFRALLIVRGKIDIKVLKSRSTETMRFIIKSRRSFNNLAEQLGKVSRSLLLCRRAVAVVAFVQERNRLDCSATIGTITNCTSDDVEREILVVRRSWLTIDAKSQLYKACQNLYSSAPVLDQLSSDLKDSLNLRRFPASKKRFIVKFQKGMYNTLI